MIHCDEMHGLPQYIKDTIRRLEAALEKFLSNPTDKASLEDRDREYLRIKGFYGGESAKNSGACYLESLSKSVRHFETVIEIQENITSLQFALTDAQIALGNHMQLYNSVRKYYLRQIEAGLNNKWLTHLWSLVQQTYHVIQTKVQKTHLQKTRLRSLLNDNSQMNRDEKVQVYHEALDYYSSLSEKERAHDPVLIELHKLLHDVYENLKGKRRR